MFRLDEEPPEEHPTPNGKPKPFDEKIEELMMKHRRVFLAEDVNPASVKDIIRRFWFLEMLAPGEPILFVINSPGGWVEGGFAIWDQIKMLSSPITTLVTGMAASFGSVLSLCAAPGRRFATPHARIMIHQPHVSGLIRGQATDLEIHAREIEKARNTLIQVYVEATGKDHETIAKALDRDTWFSPKEAVAYGLLDGIATSYEALGF